MEPIVFRTPTDGVTWWVFCGTERDNGREVCRCDGPNAERNAKRIKRLLELAAHLSDEAVRGRADVTVRAVECDPSLACEDDTMRL